MSLLLDNPISRNIKKCKFESRILNVSDYPADPRDWVHSPDKNEVDPIDLKEFSRRKLCPKVANQGSIGSCVGHSGRVLLGSSNTFQEEEPSPMWIYKTAKKYDAWAGEDYSGTSIRGAANALINEGCCFERFWPYVSNELTEPKDGAKKDALSKKINSYHVIPVIETDHIKRMLFKKPMWYAFKVRDYFFSIGYDGVIDNEKYLNSSAAGGHAVCLVGWRHIGGKLYWEFQNSWGFFFGNNGYFFMEDSLFRSEVINSIGPYYVNINGGFNNDFAEPEPVDPEPEPVDPEPEPVDPEPEPVDPEPVDPEPEPVDPEPKITGVKKYLIILAVTFFIFLVVTLLYFTFSSKSDVNLNEAMNSEYWDKRMDRELMNKDK